jgi:hypothetical protein
MVEGSSPAMAMKFKKAQTVSLKAHPEFNEKWLQGLIAEDPTILGLGDLVLRDVERSQPRAGRLDLLLHDPEANTRYEVEVQLGATDEQHIIRTIEYWDIERGRFPQYDHVAVIVAEDITSRFLNVISLFNRTIPLIAIQINALSIGDTITLNATTVLDIARLATDDDDEPGGATDRNHWLRRSSPATLGTVDSLIELVKVATGDGRLALKYNKHYIGLARDNVPDNFATFTPRRANKVFTEIRLPRSEELTARMEEAGIDVVRYEPKWSVYILRLTPTDLTDNRELLAELFQRASGITPPSPEVVSPPTAADLVCE